MKRGGLVLLVMVLATGVFRMVAPSTSTSVVPKSSESSKTNKPAPVLITNANSDLVDTIRQFYGTTATQNTDFSHPDAALNTDEAEDHLWVPKEDEEREKLRIIVAFLPDPVHTYLGLQFDRSIDAIQQAAQAEGCEFDRGEVPWDATPPPQPSDPTAGDKLKTEIKEREKWPGLLIFRKHSLTERDTKEEATKAAKAAAEGKQEKPRACDANVFVLLVAETPTGGIRKEQFRRALTIIKQIREGTADVDEQPLYLLGPTFSGSLHSLDAALKENSALVGSGPVTVFSGTVTNWHAQEVFQESDPSRYFAAFQENDKYLINSFAQLACDLHYKKGEIAILSEDETEFGDPVRDNGLCSAPTNNSGGAGLAEGGEKANDKRQDSKGQDSKGQDSIVNIHFPREISQLRGAYQTAFASNGGSQGGRALLPLDLELSGDDDDNVPDFGKVQTPVSLEASLLEINGDLHKHHIKLILLLATDPMDQLFLAQFLRRTYPAARVGISAPDVLFTREGSSLLHGTFAVSAYALVAGVDGDFCVNEGYAGPTADIEFPSALSQGLYNATIGLLTVISSGPPGNLETIPAAPYVGYGQPPSATQPGLVPAVKLSLLGRDGYWMGSALQPIRPEPADNGAAGTTQPNKTTSGCPEALGRRATVRAGQERFTSSLKPQAGSGVRNGQSDQHQPPSLNLAIVIVMALGALHAFFSVKGGILGTLEAAAQFDPTRGSSTPGEEGVRDWLVAIGGFVLAAAAVMLVTARIAGSRTTWWSGFVSVVLCALLGTYLYTLEKELRGRRKNGLAATCFAAASGVLVVAAAVVLLGRPTHMGWLWAPRSVHLTSGCSAVVTLLLLLGGTYWWVWYSMRGLVLTDRFRPRLPMTKDLPSNFIRLGDSDTVQLRELANPLSMSVKERWILVCVPLLLLVLPDRFHLLQTLEGSYFDAGVVILLVGITELLVWTLVKLMLIWGRCRPFLMAIDRLPLRDVFKGLDGFPWSSLWSPGSSTLRESYRYVARQFESLTHLLQGRDARKRIDDARGVTPPVVFDDVERLMARNEELQKKLRGEVSRGSTELSRDSMQEYVGVLRHMARISAKLAKLVLYPEWNGHVANPTPQHTQMAKDKKWFQEDAGLVALAGEYVALTYVSFLATVMVRLRSLVVAAAGIYVFLLLALSVYPFEPTVALFSVAVGLYLVSGAIVAYVYAAMHKDPTLVRLTSTTEGELGMQFWMQIAAAGAIPLLTLLAGQVPAINQVLVNFLEPAMQAVK